MDFGQIFVRVLRDVDIVDLFVVRAEDVVFFMLDVCWSSMSAFPDG
jgi:hypothetical protein